MEDKIMNTAEEVMENNDVMTEVAKTGKNAGPIALIVGTVAAVIGAAIFGVKQYKKRKFEKNHAIVEVTTEETAADEEVKG